MNEKGKKRRLVALGRGAPYRKVQCNKLIAKVFRQKGAGNTATKHASQTEKAQ